MERVDWIKFLGTAGARFVVSKQLRASGGIWLSLAGSEILIDPGPGSLVYCFRSRPKLDPLKLDAIILTHKHLDHSGDINAMIEAMTAGGTKKHGQVFAPSDALDNDPVILNYIRDYPAEITRLYEGGVYPIGKVTLSTPKRHMHSVETYGLNFQGNGKLVSVISDTRYFPGLEDYYQGEVLILYTVLLHNNLDRQIDHLSFYDAETIIKANRPKLTILTHFGMMMLRNKPHLLAENLSNKLNLKILSARDGMNILI